MEYTPEKIKTAAEMCNKYEWCLGDNCPLKLNWCRRTFASRLLTLESEAADLRARLAESEKREKAAEADLQNICASEMFSEFTACRYCKHGDNTACAKCDWDTLISAFEWRGVQAENTQPMDDPTATLRH